jgi:glycosyltransferase involved in cell wall biosynthesis
LRIVSVGRLSPEKAQVGLLEACAKLVEEGLDIELEIVGEGPERGRLEERIRRLGLGDRCKLVGALPETEVFRRVEGADVFALSSLIEGLPVSLMEAMALGVPVVAPRLTGIPELVVDGETGVLFHPADWGGLAAALRRLLEDASLRSSLAAKGREKVACEYDVDVSVEPLWKRLLEEEEIQLRS